MSKISKFVKLDKDILLEYVYNDGNLISEAYDILVNSKDRTQAYIATPTSASGNTEGNQLFRIDSTSNKYGKINTSNYSFLQIKNYSSGNPVRHDVLKFHIPINWTFGEHLGFYIRMYTFDSSNQKTYDLSNFYFDMTDVGQQYLLNFTSPPLLFQEKLWGKNITIEVPSVSELSSQITAAGLPKEDSINANLTNGAGLSLTTPIFIDFHFIDNIKTISGITSYFLGAKVTTTIPQNPEFEKLGLVVKHSVNGDFFEIYGSYSDSIAGFNQFISDSYTQGHRYYAQYNITLYEQNIRGKTLTVNVTDGFNETIEYRPIIKYSTTTAIIDIELRLIDAVDDSYIIRRASYGMLQDEVAKYSLNLTKINLKNASKPKIYNIKNNIDPTLIGYSNSMGKNNAGGIFSNNIDKGTGLGNTSLNNLGLSGDGGIGGNGGIGGIGSGGAAGAGSGLGAGNLSSGGNTMIETIKVPYPVLIDRYNIIGKSENALFNSKIFYGLGKMQIPLYPFDNILRFNIAIGTSEAPTYFDMSGLGEIKIVIKNDTTVIDFPLFSQSGEVQLTIGQLAFKVTQSKFAEIKKIYESGINLFYITSFIQSTTSVVYTGLFKIYDNKANVSELNNQAAAAIPSIIEDPKLPKATAIVTQQLIRNNNQG